VGPFELAIAAFAAKAKANANLVVRKVVMDIATSLVLRSPVGDAKYWIHAPPPGYVGGRFRGNWQFGIGEIDRTTTTKVDPDGEPTIAGIVGKLPDHLGGQIYYITNSLPYAQALEDGHSRQAPQGVVGLTWVEWRDYLRNAVASLEQ
jgi:hypothetical protein